MIQRIFVGGSRAGKTFQKEIQPPPQATRHAPLHYRPTCLVRVYASANDEMPDPKAPRYA